MERFKQALTDPFIGTIIIALWGGMVRGFNCKREEFRWTTFFFRVFSAGFVGAVVGLLLKDSEHSRWVQFAVVGISGFAAVDILPILSTAIKEGFEAVKRARVKRLGG